MQNSIMCSICGIDKKKYKCPRCAAPYCSVKCYQVHCLSCSKTQEKKEEANELPPISKEMNALCSVPAVASKYNSFYRVPDDKLVKLSESKRIMYHLSQPGLKERILSITSSHRPKETLQSIMEEYPDFYDFMIDTLNCIDFHPTRESRTLNPQIVTRLFKDLGIDISDIGLDN
ncbi:putative HIT zinc finger [Monocercomonoides exilis]|uniref:putative HIT zinc finger n=1 Tax=Monocercomonoides exilis TaxID=2049356 RepID=UPI0035599370|nr:putative HIT zinc finger [Monocercomonoides exilis]|eukprot:MONOS_977.1-p1 / transcript=MONOS_977.1 / gene=MONOS_977 / organism=Monocercomonoides_exilis_PA203 / gene_product=unspecified product / transcript_product=unspecified product / location=Mono_scaffold00016:125755-126329(-) / protein_length=173 / sequence_SO=supercontig / SO=protein_coding / is_pseudo=false